MFNRCSPPPPNDVHPPGVLGSATMVGLTSSSTHTASITSFTAAGGFLKLYGQGGAHEHMHRGVSGCASLAALWFLLSIGTYSCTPACVGIAKMIGFVYALKLPPLHASSLVLLLNWSECKVTW